MAKGSARQWSGPVSSAMRPLALTGWPLALTSERDVLRQPVEPEQRKTTCHDGQHRRDEREIRRDLGLLLTEHELRRELLVDGAQVGGVRRVVVLGVGHLRDLLECRLVQPRADLAALKAKDRS